MAKNKHILYVTALDRNGELVHANDSLKGQEYTCPGCKKEMILRKSKNLLRRPHFAHKALVSNCSPESVLHLSFKELLYKKIKDCIISGTPFPVEWTCGHCDEKHLGNLIKKANGIKLEQFMDVCKPDIALLDSEGKVYAVIEVVVTHHPEENVLQYYKDNNIIPVIIELENDESLKWIELNPFPIKSLHLCTTHPICEKCNSYKVKKTLMIMNVPCSKCKSRMKITAVYSKGVMFDHFDSSDIQLANQYGVLLKEQYSKTVGYRYMANTCPKCKGFCGRFFLINEYCRKARYGYINYKEIEAGFCCLRCESKH